MTPSSEDQLLSTKFENRDELLASVRAFYLKRGFALSILRSKQGKNVVLRCDRGGQYRNTHKILEGERKKAAASQLINCPFQLQGKRCDDGRWIVEMKNKSHNHEASKDMSGHPICRRLSNSQMKAVEHMSNSGVAPKQILSNFRQDEPSIQANSKTIYNAKAKIQKSNLDGKPMIQALLEELGQGGFIYNILRDEVSHITCLFMAHPKSILLTKSYPNVFVMDCTYKTNKYKMPLLEIVGVTSFNTSFYSAFAFLKRENTENYVWALEMFKNILGQNQPIVIVTDRELAIMKAIENVFPSTTNVLCIWHINKNVLAKCKKFFETEEEWEKFFAHWQIIVYSSTEDEYKSNWSNFESTYKEKKDALEYIKQTWLPYKEKFVSAWTEKHLHLGNRASSRAEGAHSKLKQYLQVSTGNLQIVKKKICLAIDNEFNEIKVQLAREKIQVPHSCNIPYFKNLIFRISHFALHKLHKQYEMAKRGTMLPICESKLMGTMGMPCAHKMENWKTGSLLLDQIHSQWRIDTRELDDMDSNSYADPDSQMKQLLDNLYKEYLKWPVDKKKLAQEKIAEIVNQPDVLFEPIIPPQKNRFDASKKRKGISSTRRDPSQIEIAEASWCGASSNVVSQPNQRQHGTSRDNTVTPEFEVPVAIADDNVFDWLDSNM